MLKHLKIRYFHIKIQISAFSLKKKSEHLAILFPIFCKSTISQSWAVAALQREFELQLATVPIHFLLSSTQSSPSIYLSAQHLVYLGALHKMEQIVGSQFQKEHIHWLKLGVVQVRFFGFSLLWHTVVELCDLPVGRPHLSFGNSCRGNLQDRMSML